MDYAQFIQSHWDDALLFITSAVTIASIIVKYTDNKWDDNIVKQLIKWVSLAPKSR